MHHVHATLERRQVPVCLMQLWAASDDAIVPSAGGIRPHFKVLACRAGVTISEARCW